MKFVYLDGPYAEFRGIPFVNGNPSSVFDQGTIDALLKRQDYRKVEEEKSVPKRPILRLRKK